MDAIALFLAGRMLENLVGRAWFGAIYVIGGLGGSLLSFALAIALNRDHREEALATARQLCAAVTDGPLRKLLDDQKLCGT